MSSETKHFGYNLEAYAVNLFCQFETKIEEDNSRISKRIDDLTCQLNRVEKALSMINKDRSLKKDEEKKKHKDEVDYSHSPEAMDLFDKIRTFSFDIKEGEPLTGDTLFDEACYSWNDESLDRVVDNMQNHVKIINSVMQKETIFQTENQYKLKDAMQPASSSAKGQEEQNEYIIRKTGRQ